jgi:hypothetical protein
LDLAEARAFPELNAVRQITMQRHELWWGHVALQWPYLPFGCGE